MLSSPPHSCWNQRDMAIVSVLCFVFALLTIVLVCAVFVFLSIAVSIFLVLCENCYSYRVRTNRCYADSEKELNFCKYRSSMTMLYCHWFSFLTGQVEEAVDVTRLGRKKVARRLRRNKENCIPDAVSVPLER